MAGIETGEITKGGEMNLAELQQWLVDHGQHITVDGKPGPATRAAIVAAFTNTSAPAIDDSQVAAIALRLGCTPKQLRAVAKVESGGGAFDAHGRPKILFERHYFHRLTQGKWSTASFSNSQGGGYSEDSWEKLAQAAMHDPWAAFQSISIGKFQIMGAHWNALGYASPLDMGYSAVTSEAGSYEMLARFIEKNGLKAKLQAISANPDACRPLAAAYNGPNYEKFSYHTKLAAAMA